jgi:taurine dioxygenase
MQVRKLAYALGAEITGVDLREDLDAGTIAAIRGAWLEHLVLAFPGQELTTEQHIRFSRCFGELELHALKNLQGKEHPEILEITNRIVDGKRSETAEVGRQWHTDGSATMRPSLGSLLYCRAMPEAGGNTWFASLYAAYDALSDTMKGVLEPLESVQDLGYFYGNRGIGARDAGKVSVDIGDNPAVVQPLVTVHPETGRKALFVNESLIRQIHGMSREESAGLLQYLHRHAVRPEFTYRHYWRVGDLIMWDNRCTQHLAPRDYDPDQVRNMCRTTLKGHPQGRYLHDAAAPSAASH